MNAEALTVGLGTAAAICSGAVAAVLWLHNQLRQNAEVSARRYDQLDKLLREVGERVARIEGMLHHSPAE